MSRTAMQGESFEIQRRGDIVIVEPSPEVESMSDSMIEQAAQLVLAPLKDDPPSGVIFDLSRVNYFGSLFITFLLALPFANEKAGRRGTGPGGRFRPRSRIAPNDQPRHPVGALRHPRGSTGSAG